ncbi:MULTISPECIES: hypothetical protein [unclassified Mesorhizobium]|nr:MULTISPECIES: hypothetical protein [unclassified Mesorhizobium]
MAANAKAELPHRMTVTPVQEDFAGASYQIGKRLSVNKRMPPWSPPAND